MSRMPVLLVLAMIACGKKTPETPVTGNTNATPVEATPTEAAPVETPAETPAEKPADPQVAAAEAEAKAKALREEVRQAASLLTANNPTSAQQAADLFDAMTKQHPELGEAWVNLGVARHQLGDDVAAKAAWTTATQRTPQLGHAWLYLGALRETSGDIPGALTTYRTGIQNDAMNEELRVGLVGALRKTGAIEDAIREAHAALKINSNSVPIYNNLGLAYLDANNLDLAQFVFQKAVNDIVGASDNPYIRSNLGWIQYKRGQKGTALFNLQAAAKDPATAPVPALIFLSQVYMDDRNYGDVVPLLESALKQAPNNHGVLMNLALAYRGAGRLDDAKKLYQRALELKPENPDPYFNLGILAGDYFKLYDESKADFQKYIDMGGKEKTLATDYIAAVDKEAKKADRKAKAAAEKKAREEERKRQEEEKKRQEANPAPTPPADTPAPTPPADTPAPPADTPAPPADTPAPPADTPAPTPPADTPAPPADTPPPTPPATPADPWGQPAPPADSPAPPTDTPAPNEPSPWGNPP
jgi:tetratricopeptide (TPR) repeat protein